MRFWHWVLLIAVALWVAKHPVEASNFVHSIGTFFSNLASG